MSSSSPIVTVMICTYNRAVSLRQTLDSVEPQVLPEGWSLEILVIDNNSRDNTAETVLGFAKTSKHTVRHIREENQGVAYARNRGLREAAGKYALFIDDDALAAENWIAEMIRSFEETGADMVGGKIDPLWIQEKPEWMDAKLQGPIIRLDYGPTRKKVLHAAQTFLTANLGFRIEAAGKHALFDTSLGRCRDRWVGGEDYELCSRWHREGAAIYYEPAAVVMHKVEPERLTPAFYKNWFKDIGYTQGHQLPWKSHYRWSIIPAWKWVLLLRTLAQYAAARTGVLGKTAGLRAEIWWAFQKSFFLERLDHWKSEWRGDKKPVCLFSRARIPENSNLKIKEG